VLARILFVFSAVVLAATGVVYLAVPGLAVGIVDIESTPDSSCASSGRSIRQLPPRVRLVRVRRYGVYSSASAMGSLQEYWPQYFTLPPPA
jgi:hypothetical protein